jgi:hypothetical protein
MCCGKTRTAVSQKRVSSPPPRRAVQTSPATAIKQRTNAAYFEYTGKTAMTVRGPVSGATYRFVSPGSRLAVDLRDSRHLAAVPNLAPVRSL